MNESSYQQYVKVTLALESLLEFHPEFAPRLDSQFAEHEVSAFEEVYQPNWDELGMDAEEYFALLKRGERPVVQEANSVLAKFATLHGVDLQPPAF